MAQTVTCPSFCTGEHRPEWRAHSREIREIENSFTDETVVISVAQYGDGEPQISISLDGPDESSVNYLTSSVATHLADVLRAVGATSALADALDEASDVVEGSMDTPRYRAGVKQYINVVDCDACNANKCQDCRRPHGTRLSADGEELPTCCCGRRLVKGEQS